MSSSPVWWSASHSRSGSGDAMLMDVVIFLLAVFLGYWVGGMLF